MYIAYWSIVNCINIPLYAYTGSNTNWFAGISKPIIAEIRGILNTLAETHFFWFIINPFWICYCGTVGDIKG